MVGQRLGQMVAGEVEGIEHGRRAGVGLDRRRLAGQEGAAVGRSGASPIRGNEYNSFWQDHGRPLQVFRQTSLIVDPKDGRLPYTPDAKQAAARATATQ